MTRQYTKVLLFGVLLCLYGLPCLGQFSINKGYVYSYFQPNEFNRILQTFNQNNDVSNQAFDDLNDLHGFMIGARYELNYVALELTWTNRFENVAALLNTNGGDEEQKVFYRNSSFSLGLENTFGIFSYGFSVDLNQTIVKFRAEPSNDKIQLLSEPYWSGQFYLSFSTPNNNNIRFSIRPFLQFPIDGLDLSDFHRGLNNVGTTEKIEERAVTFGIKLVFING